MTIAAPVAPVPAAATAAMPIHYPTAFFDPYQLQRERMVYLAGHEASAKQAAADIKAAADTKERSYFSWTPEMEMTLVELKTNDEHNIQYSRKESKGAMFSSNDRALDWEKVVAELNENEIPCTKRQAIGKWELCYQKYRAAKNDLANTGNKTTPAQVASRWPVFPLLDQLWSEDVRSEFAKGAGTRGHSSAHADGPHRVSPASCCSGRLC
ncbi:MAG: myb/SANT-like DNA-binding domain-containing protein [Devosia sp.]|nr:myb/SANT-like DNA-binding domain-containing protein [Devosia sp.]